MVLRYKAPQEIAATSEKADVPNVKPIPYRNAKLAMIGVSIAAYAAFEYGWFSFATAMYQYLEIKMDATTATHMQSVVSATYTLGRLTTAFITIKLVPDVIISYHFVTLITGMLVIFFGRNSQTVIYAGSAILGRLHLDIIHLGYFASILIHVISAQVMVSQQCGPQY